MAILNRKIWILFVVILWGYIGLKPVDSSSEGEYSAPTSFKIFVWPFKTNILEATLRGMLAEGFDYRGFIFFGLMVHKGRCSLLEYNVRLGDPETQAVLPLMDSDFAELCLAIEDGSLGSLPVTWKKGAVCAPVAVADGYPGSYRKGYGHSVSGIYGKRRSHPGASGPCQEGHGPLQVSPNYRVRDGTAEDDQRQDPQGGHPEKGHGKHVTSFTTGKWS